jgi:hypothetical protein
LLALYQISSQSTKICINDKKGRPHHFQAMKRAIFFVINYFQFFTHFFGSALLQISSMKKKRKLPLLL